MKDRQLDEQFKEYFDGVEIPELPNNIVADAKKSVKRRDGTLSRLVKIASVAASFVLVFAVALILITKNDFHAEHDGSGQISTYDVALLRFDEENAYTLSSINSSLKFIENLAYASNADVKKAVTSHFANEETAFAYAEVTVIAGARYDAEIYVEFAEDTFAPLAEYADGAAGSYGGISYYLTREIADNGEPVNKLLAVQNGVKYYFFVQSSDENSYLKCLALLLQNS